MQSSQNASAGRDRAKPLVYLVDDEPMVLELTSQILQPLGYELRQFRSPVEALETFTNAERKPDLVITDYAMGPMNGIELMVAIRKVRPEQRIFLVSGTVGTEVCGEGPANPDAFMPKPFQVTEFSGVVYRLTHWLHTRPRGRCSLGESMKKKFPLILILLLAGGFIAWKVTSSRSRENPNELSLSGNVDIREVVLGFRVAGRISEMNAEEGDSVRKDHVIAKLDAEPFKRELAEAEGLAASAEAKLKLMQAGYRREEIEQATAVLRERQVSLDNARRLNERQQELAKTQAISSQERDDAEARYREAEARMKSAQEQLSLLRAGFRPEEIAAARADAERTRAGVARAQLRLEDTTLLAPEDGIILTRAQEPGAIVQAGTPVVTLSLKSPVWVRTYLRETNLGKVRPGMPVEIFTDSHPDKPYEGQIGYISPRAEFTPRNVETEELRTSLVYRMRVVANDPAGELRQGMPVTVRVHLQNTNAPASAAR